MNADGRDRTDTLSAWHGKQELADILNRDVRTITRMVARGEVEKDDTDPLHPRFRYRGRVAAKAKARTQGTDAERESVRLILETLTRHAERIEALETEVARLREENAALRAPGEAERLSAGQDGQQEDVRPSRPAWWRRWSWRRS
jgi:hypothetical protein